MVIALSILGVIIALSNFLLWVGLYLMPHTDIEFNTDLWAYPFAVLLAPLFLFCGLVVDNGFREGVKRIFGNPFRGLW